jgi:hypothetical protein
LEDSQPSQRSDQHPKSGRVTQFDKRADRQQSYDAQPDSAEEASAEVVRRQKEGRSASVRVHCEKADATNQPNRHTDARTTRQRLSSLGDRIAPDERERDRDKRQQNEQQSRGNQRESIPQSWVVLQ